ncbi:MAG: hypothetical protein H0U69_00680 [Trueperaceae bacterium]|nr:hypothetical protein [Trueperaceae bacterium]
MVHVNLLFALTVLLGVGSGLALAHDDVPKLPFADNPDPDACGIPQPLGAGFTGVLHANFEGALPEPIVHLVDSHLRRSVTGHVPAGSVVEVSLFQNNPTLDFYFVRWHGPDGWHEGWVPAPYLTLVR